MDANTTFAFFSGSLVDVRWDHGFGYEYDIYHTDISKVWFMLEFYAKDFTGKESSQGTESYHIYHPNAVSYGFPLPSYFRITFPPGSIKFCSWASYTELYVYLRSDRRAWRNRPFLLGSWSVTGYHSMHLHLIESNRLIGYSAPDRENQIKPNQIKSSDVTTCSTNEYVCSTCNHLEFSPILNECVERSHKIHLIGQEADSRSWHWMGSASQRTRFGGEFNFRALG